MSRILIEKDTFTVTIGWFYITITIYFRNKLFFDFQFPFVISRGNDTNE